MQTFDHEIERLITEGLIDKELCLSYATNRTNLALKLSTQSGHDAGPAIAAKDTSPAAGRKAAPSSSSELDDLIER